MKFKSAKSFKAPQQRRKALFGGSILLIFTAIIFLGVWQIDQVREFFSRASGVPANLMIDTQAVLGPMLRPWRYLAQGGESFNWRLAPLNQPVKELKPQYIRIDHIYDFYEIVQGSPGNLSYDFSKFDQIIDDILAVGAKPYIALSYMPPAIASGDIISKPQRWEDWQDVVYHTIQHVSGTRGISDVYYEVWNEPDLFGGWKYYGDKNYLTLYTYAVRGAMQTRGVKDFRIGGPAITALYENWFRAMAKHAINNNLRYDFFSWHRYDHDLDVFQEDMLKAKTWLADYPQLEPLLELHITEWGPDSENHPGYDSKYSAAHAVAGSIAMMNQVEKAFLFEIQDGKDPEGKQYWGRWGMFNHQDFGAAAKPRYHAMRMLDQISDQRLQITGQGSWVKALAAKNDRGNTEMIVANFDKYGRHAETVPVTFENIEPGNYNLNLYFLSGRNQTLQIATTAAILRTDVALPANSVMYGELVRQ